MHDPCWMCHARIQKVLPKGKRIQKALKAGHHRPASETPFNGVKLDGRWWPNIKCWLGSFVIFQGDRTSIAKKNPYILWFYGGRGGPDPLSPSGSAHVSQYLVAEGNVWNKGHLQQNECIYRRPLIHLDVRGSGYNRKNQSFNPMVR